MSEHNTYHVKPRIKTGWFSKPKIVYDLMLKYRYWDDPIYGNGGGEWSDACKKVCTFNTLEEAIDFEEQMNEKSGS